MSHQPDRLEYLYRQYINRSCTYEEMQELFQYVSDPQRRDRLETIAEEHLENLQAPETMPEIDWEYMYNKIIPQQAGRVVTMEEEPETPRISFIWRKIAVAASILLVLAAGGYWWLGRAPKRETATTDSKPVTNDVAPGGNKAILTLADNSTIVLDSAANGKLAEQGSSVVNKTKDGELKYQLATDNKSGIGRAIGYNTLATPRGGQYQLVLPDGSKVWLNAASSIRYPTAFTGNERKVDITGEVYFEVEKDPAKPFRVHFKSADREGTVEVLGTHFNINAYDDEPKVKTTLLEGKVRVMASTESQTTNYKPQTVLKPGEQVSISQSSHLSQPIPVQTDEVMAWKNGLFKFNNADLPTVMRQLVRWYDVEVVYEQRIPPIRFGGEISSNSNLSQVLQVLQFNGLKARIETRKIIISK